MDEFSPVAGTTALRLVGAIAAALTIAACSPPESGSSLDATDLDALPRLRLEEVGRIGSVEDPKYGFSSIGAVDVDRDGNVWVFEYQAREIRRYSPDGELELRLGGKGDGPGEFSPLGGVEFGVGGDTVWAFDLMSRRLTLFDRSGPLLSARQVEEVRVNLHVPGQTTLMGPSHLDADGLFLGERGMTFTARYERGVPYDDTVRIPRVRFNGEGEVVDTAGFFPVVREQAEPELLEVGASRYLMPPAPATGPLVVRLPDGLVRIDREVPEAPNALRITRLTHRGDTIGSRLFTYRPKPFPEAVLDSAVARSVRGVGTTVMLTSAGTMRLERRAEDSAAARVRMRRDLSFPEFQPPVRGYRVASDGALWLEREDQGGESQVWAVLDAEDVPVGEIELPRDLRVEWTDGRSLWAVERDELSVPWLVEYRIHRP